MQIPWRILISCLLRKPLHIRLAKDPSELLPSQLLATRLWKDTLKPRAASLVIQRLTARQMAVISVWPVCFASCEFETGEIVESGLVCSGHRGFCRDCVERLSPTKLGVVYLCFFALKTLKCTWEINTGPSIQCADDGILTWKHPMFLSSQASLKKSAVKQWGLSTEYETKGLLLTKRLNERGLFSSCLVWQWQLWPGNEQESWGSGPLMQVLVFSWLRMSICVRARVLPGWSPKTPLSYTQLQFCVSGPWIGHQHPWRTY